MLKLDPNIQNLIFEKAIHPNNCNAAKLRTACKSFNDNQYILDLQVKRNICDYCKKIFLKWKDYPKFMISKGAYSYRNKEVLCQLHQYYCNSCKRIGTFDNYCFKKNKCKKCADKNYLYNVKAISKELT